MASKSKALPGRSLLRSSRAGHRFAGWKRLPRTQGCTATESLRDCTPRPGSSSLTPQERCIRGPRGGHARVCSNRPRSMSTASVRRFQNVQPGFRLKLPMQSPTRNTLVRKPILRFNPIPFQGHPEGLFDHGAKACASLGRKFPSPDREVIGNVNRGLHDMGTGIYEYGTQYSNSRQQETGVSQAR